MSRTLMDDIEELEFGVIVGEPARRRLVRGARIRSWLIDGVVVQQRQCYKCLGWKLLSEYSIRRVTQASHPIISVQPKCKSCSKKKT